MKLRMEPERNRCGFGAARDAGVTRTACVCAPCLPTRHCGSRAVGCAPLCAIALLPGSPKCVAFRVKSQVGGIQRAARAASSTAGGLGSAAQ